MDLGLKGKRALITGSTAGIGFAIAQSLAREGAQAIVNGRTGARVANAVDRIRAAVPGAVVDGVAADLAGDDGFRRVVAAHPRVDILVNNLGIFEPKPFDQISDDDWRRFFEVNVLSGVRLSRHYLPPMREANWGRIIFISSESALQPPPEMIHYGFTKTAQLSVSRGLAETTAGTGVTVNSVLPGPTASEGVGEYVRKLAVEQGADVAAVERDFFRTMRPTSLLQRFATPDEIAALVTYVASTQSPATNGAALRADGGLVRLIF